MLTICKRGGYHSVRYDTPDDFPDSNAFYLGYEEVVELQCRMNGAVICILPDGPHLVIQGCDKSNGPIKDLKHVFEANFE